MKKLAIVVVVIIASFCLYSFPVLALPKNAIGRWGRGSIEAVALSPDDKLLGVATSIGIFLYETLTLVEVAFFETNVLMNAVDFSSDGNLLAGGGEDGTIKLWDTSILQEVAILEGHSRSVQTVSFSPDGKLLASGSRNVKVWDVLDFHEVATLPSRHSYAPVAFNHDGSILAVGGLRSVKLWDTSNFQEAATLLGHSSFLSSLAFSPDGKLLASGCIWDDSIKLWDVLELQEVATLNMKGLGWSISFSSDGNLLAAGGYDQVGVWETSSLQEMVTFETGDGWRLICLGQDGKLLVGVSGTEITVWDTSTHEEVTTLRHSTLTSVGSILFSPDSRLLASSSTNEEAVFWDITNDKVISVFGEKDIHAWSDMSFSPDGSLLAFAGKNNTVKLWDVSDSQEMATLEGHRPYISTFAFSPDRIHLASGSSDRTVRLWDISTLQTVAIFSLAVPDVRCMAFSSDGRLLAIGSSDYSIRLWDTQARKRVATIKGHLDYVDSVEFSPDGRLLASGSCDGTVKLWDMSTFQEVATLTYSSSSVYSVCFSPDSNLLAASGLHGTIKLWDISTLREVAVLEGHGRGQTVCFSPDGLLLASGSNDGIVLLWHLDIFKEFKTDATPAYITNPQPQVNSTDISPGTNIYLETKDDSGVDRKSIEMLVNGVKVEPVITPVENGFSLLYDPPTDLGFNQTVTVKVSASDLYGNSLSEEYSFTTEQGKADLKIIALQAYSDDKTKFPIAGEDSYVRLEIKNTGNGTWQSRELIALVNVVDEYDTEPNGFWTNIWKDDTIRQNRHIRLGKLDDIQENEIIEKLIPFRFTAPDFSDQLYVELLSGEKDGKVDEGSLRNNSLSLDPFFVRFSNEAYINCLGEVLTGLSHGVVNSSKLEYMQTAYDLTLHGKELIGDLADLDTALANEDYEKAGELTWKHFNNLNEALYKEAGKELIEETVPFVDAAWNEFNGIGCGAAIGHTILYQFVKGKSTAMAEYSNVTTALVQSPSDIIVEIDGKTTSVDQNGNTQEGITGSTAYLAGELKVVHIPGSEQNYSVTLKGTGSGTTNLTLITTTQDEIVIKLYENIPTKPDSVAVLDVSKDEEIHVDLDNDGTIDSRISAAIEPKGKLTTTWGTVKNKLYQNYPNPFNPETWIPYQLAEEADVVIRIYNVNGHIIRVLDLGMRKAGAYLSKSKAACWDGKDESGQAVSSGIYFYRIEAGDFSATRKMVITR